MGKHPRKSSLFGPVARFEWTCQRRSPVLWVGFALFFLLTFGATTVDQIQIGSRGNVNINSPFAIVQTVGIMSLFAMFIVVALVAGTVIRDEETGFAPILRSTRLTRWAYLGGRFVGANLARCSCWPRSPWRLPWARPCPGSIPSVWDPLCPCITCGPFWSWACPPC